MTAALVGVASPPRMIGPREWPESWGPAPRWATPRNPELKTYGPVAARYCKAITGHDPHPHQRYTWDVSLEVRADGQGWEHPEVLKTIQRQSGKSFEQAPLTGQRAAMAPDSSIFITAQSGDKAVSRWAVASRTICRAQPEVRMLVSTAHERTLWPNGSSFRPFAPKEGALDGETPALAQVDELWAFDAMQQDLMEQSFAPAIFMNPWGQLIKTSTAGTERSGWLNADRERGRAVVESGAPSSFAYFEWGIPEGVGDTAAIDLPDDALVRLVLEHHPLTGRHPRITFDALMDELGKGRTRFLRGLGNLTVEVRAEGIVDPEVWERQAERAKIPTTAVVGIGVDVDPIGRESTIYAGWRDPETGIGVVEIIERGSGQGWVPARVQQLTQRWKVGAVAVEYLGAGRSVGDKLERLGVEIVRMSGPDSSAAASRFLDDLQARVQVHDEKRDSSVGDAMRAAQVRRLKTGPVIEAKGTEPVTAIRAAVAAMWAADHTTDPEPEPAPFKIW